MARAANLGTVAGRWTEGRRCILAASCGGIRGEVEESEREGGPTPGARGSAGDPGRATTTTRTGGRRRRRRRPSWRSEPRFRGSRAAPGGRAAAGAGPSAARWNSYWEPPALCGGT